jgi:recombination protein RecR
MSDLSAYPASLQRLVRELARLPSIGHKSATRLAYHLITSESAEVTQLAQAILSAKELVRLCQHCFFITEQPICKICSDPGRDHSLLCVVERPVDVISIERSSEYRGLYHVLHGLWAPLRGLGPESMKIRELLERVNNVGIREVILALNATVEGDATSLYLAKMLSDNSVRSTRLAQGLSKGAELEYADDITLSRAFQGRKSVEL